MHGLIFETSVYYWQDQPGNYVSEADEALLTDPDGRLSASPQPFDMKRSALEEIFTPSNDISVISELIFTSIILKISLRGTRPSQEDITTFTENSEKKMINIKKK